MSAVQHPLFQDVESYSGFITVDKRYNSNMFFWYVPAKNNRANAPVIVWLQGGPGASSLVGLFEEHGPFRVRSDLSVEKRLYSWHENHHMIYVDNPVGSGFSFTQNDYGYVTNEIEVGIHLYSFLTQFYSIFLLTLNPLYIAGESYGGKYVPAFGHALLKAGQPNLRGVIIGNGYTDPLNQLAYGDYLYQHGLIDVHAKARFDRDTATVITQAKLQDWTGAKRVLDELLDGVDGHASYLKNVSGIASYYNYLQVSEQDVDDDAMMKFLQQPDVRRAIHVGDLPFQNADDVGKVAQKLAKDMLKSASPYVEALLARVDVLFYNGQLDVICAYPMAENFLRKLSFGGSEEYKNAVRQVYRVDGEVAGYLKRAGNLREMMIRNAGYMVPKDQPKWAFDIVSSFTHGKI